MKTINLNLQKQVDHSYDIIIGQDLTPQLIEDLQTKNWGSRYAIVTDETVQQYHGMRLKKALRQAGIKCDIFSFRAGEKNKTLATIRKLATKMIHLGYNRSDCIIALGGGVPGDIAGFLASVFMRGIPFIQVPTTLLAMVDSSVGGKTGVDLDIGKNLIGVFYQPKKVYIDTKYLETLAKKQLSSGLAEVIKYSCIYDSEFFEYLEKDIEKVFALDHMVLEKVIQLCCAIKAELVEKDEKESGLRMILNYGHTIGHAVEQLSNYQILHGQAVSIGICAINDKAVNKKLLSSEDANRIKNLLKQANLPVNIPEKFTEAKLTKAMMKDKKVKDGQIRYIVCREIGKVEIRSL